MKQLKICFTSNSSPWTKFHGGGQIFVHNIAEALSKLGHEITVLYAGPDKQIPSKDNEKFDYRIAWAPYIGYPWTPVFRQLNSFTIYQKLKQIHKQYNFDIVNAVGEEALFFPRFCRDTNTFLFFSIEHPQLNSVKPQFRWPNFFQFLLRLFRSRDLRIIRFACLHSHGVITPSQFTKSQAEKIFGMKSERIQVIYHGIIDEMLIENEKHIRNVNDAMIFYGRLEPQKGVDLLIKAYQKLLNAKIARQDLVIIGTGPYIKDYKRMVAKLDLKDKVHFKGWRSPEDIRNIMSKASFCILPSRSESFGLTMAETLAQGLPLVSTSAGSIPEVLDQGRGGWMAKPNDDESLFAKMKEALENFEESQKKARHGREYVRKKFIWEKAAKSYEAFYYKLMAQSTTF